MIGLIAVTAAGRAHAQRLAAAWPGETRTYSGSAADAVAKAWTECDALVCHLATGATVRLVAPHLGDKHTDPAVVCVDEAARYAVALLGGHHGRHHGRQDGRQDGRHQGAPEGANGLAARVADVLDAEPVVTTATDAAGIPGLDTLGWPVEGAVAAVSQGLLDSEPVRLVADATWPIPALPATVSPGAASVDTAADGGAQTGAARILVTDRAVPLDGRTAVLRPPSLVVGVGASRGVAADEVLDLVDTVLADAGLSPASVTRLATVDLKADEPGIVAAAEKRGWPLVTYPARDLAAVPVPNPSDVVRRAVGTPSVAEAAALLGAGGTDLERFVVPKRASAMCTVAVARRSPRGRLALVGIGPGARDLMTPRAREEIRRASVVVALDQYADQVRDLVRPGTRMLVSGLGHEEARARTAVAEARDGHAVALLGSGDAGIYAMASPALEVAGAGGPAIDVVGVPGVTAGLAAAALLGAPLGHDHAVISLSDLHTPWEAIERRVRAAAEADLVCVFYNPRSRKRDWQLRRALDILAAHRPPGTPVGVVRDATRDTEHVLLSTLADLTAGSDADTVDMLSVVLVGGTNTRTVAGRMVTPRGYRWLPR